MTNKRRVTITLDSEHEAAIAELKKTKVFAKSSTSRIIRFLMDIGIGRSGFKVEEKDA